MQCLSVKQPWATLLVGGTTRYIVRDWRTFLRGRLAIQASRRFPAGNVELCCDPAMRPLLRENGFDYAMEMPTAAIIGTAELVDCTYGSIEALSCLNPNDPAVEFGIVQPGLWIWEFRNARRLRRPVPHTGRLGVFPVPGHLLEG
jgi:hypothetical protein